MKRLFIALLVLGLIVLGNTFSNADSTRTTPHKFRSFSSNTAVAQSATIFRISGYATSAAMVFAIHNCTTLGDVATTNCAVEGGEATQYDPVAPMYFGEEGLTLDTGMTVVVNGGTIVVEYL